MAIQPFTHNPDFRRGDSLASKNLIPADNRGADGADNADAADDRKSRNDYRPGEKRTSFRDRDDAVTSYCYESHRKTFPALPSVVRTHPLESSKRKKGEHGFPDYTVS